MINDYELRKPFKINLKNGQQYQNRDKEFYLILLHYPNGKHHIFIVNETERQLLKRIKSICYQAQDKIKYLNVYTFNKQTLSIWPYGEYTYRNKDIKSLELKRDQEKEINIALYRYEWERIASACISIADYDIINEEIKQDLRKTYFQIKKSIR